MRKAIPGGAAFALLTLMSVAFGTLAAEQRGAAGCATMRAALKAMLESEYAFSQKAQTSVAGAFLDYLAEDSWVLNPGPAPGRPIYQAAKESKNTLEWYQAMGDVAPSGDLGFTAGPWVYTNTDSGKQLHGHFLTIWKRDARCQWHVQIDGGISHAMPKIAEPKLLPGRVPMSATGQPPPNLVAQDAAGHAASDFQDTARRDGLAAALRTYGRDFDFVFFTDEQSPIGGAGAASEYLSEHPIMGAWKEVAHGRSADASLMYSVGELTDRSKRSTHAYVQIWQYDPKVANWGLRVLLVNPLPPPKAKS
jgi:ketosteroid isomerase-like protein